MDPNPVSRSIELTPELLISQGRSLRALARSLLGDAQAAEDVEQETWLAVLTRPARVHGRFSAWLGGVARHLAHRNRRGTTRRREREQRAARGERVEASQEKALLREETLRSVTQALLALEEPYRTPLILRFFEDRSPAEIARELELPPSTVKSRIERGLERLRARLTSEHGGAERWTSGLVLLAGARSSPSLPPGTSSVAGTVAGPITTGIGALLMSWKIGAALAMTAAGSLVWWSSTTDGAQDERALPASSIVAAGTTTPGAARSPAQEAAAVAPQAREPAAEEAQAASRSGIPDAGAETGYPYEIEGTVRDEYDGPLEGALVFLAPRGFPVNQMAVTDSEGRFEIAFEGRRGAFPALFSVRGEGGLELGPIEIQLTARAGIQLDVALRRDRAALERRVAETVRAAAGQALTEEAARGTPAVFRNPLTASRVSFSGALEPTNGAGGFRWPLPASTCMREPEGEIVQLKGAMWRMRAELEEREVVSREQQVLALIAARGWPLASSGEPPPESAVVRGIVRDAESAPVPGARVSWRLDGRASIVHADQQGNFALEDLPSGIELAIDAGGGDDGRARGTFVLVPGEQRVWDPLLDRGAEVRGRLLGPGGKPIAGALVELWKVSANGAWNDATFTREDGAFAIPNVPAGNLELHVVPDGRSGGFPARVVTRLRPNDDLGDLVLAAEELAQCALRVKLVDADGGTPLGAEVRVWQEGSRRGRLAAGPHGEGVHELAGLPPGRYRIEVGCELGWRDLGAPWLAPGETLDLGVVPFERLGILALDVPEVREGERATLSALHGDVYGTVDDGAVRPMQLLLAPGSYRLTLQSRSARTSIVVRIHPGTVTGYVWQDARGGRTLSAADASSPRLPAPVDCTSCHASTLRAESAALAR